MNKLLLIISMKSHIQKFNSIIFFKYLQFWIQNFLKIFFLNLNKTKQKKIYNRSKQTKQMIRYIL